MPQSRSQIWSRQSQSRRHPQCRRSHPLDAQSVNALGQLAQSALLEVEEASVAGGSRALGLLRALGGLYEQTHELQPSAAFASLSALCDHLLGPFPWLAATVRRLAKEHQISSLPALGQVFADGVHESVAPTGGPTQATFTHVPMVQRKYDFFINHCQTSGQDQCNTLSLLLKQKGAKVWYDMQAQDLTATGMEEGVSQSRNVLMFLSDDLMGRPFCQAEQRWGKLYGCNFVGIVEKDSRHSPADFGKEKERAPVDLKYLLDDVEFMPYRRRKYEAEAMLDELMRRGGVNVAVQAPEGIPPSMHLDLRASGAPGPELDSKLATLFGALTTRPEWAIDGWWMRNQSKSNALTA
jgi:hypothetical protein